MLLAVPLGRNMTQSWRVYRHLSAITHLTSVKTKFTFRTISAGILSVMLPVTESNNL